MSLSYGNHVTFPVIGTKDGTTRTSVALTDAYDVANNLDIKGIEARPKNVKEKNLVMFTMLD